MTRSAAQTVLDLQDPGSAGQPQRSVKPIPLVADEGEGAIRMAAIPSIKGAVFATVVEDVEKLVSSEEISPNELGRRLTPEDLAILKQPVQAAAWYDIRIYARFLELLRDTAGQGRNDYLIGRGARSAERLLQAGIYQQLEYVKRTQLGKAVSPQERFLAYGRDLRLCLTMSYSIFNFARQELKVDPEHESRYQIEVSEAGAFPEVSCWTALGFANRVTEEYDEPSLWRWERPQLDLVLYRMVRSL